jgi:sugar phosphate isomerase/epimerase
MALYGDFETNLETISELGYKGVELLLRDAGSPDIPDILDNIKKHRLEIAALATSPLPAEDGLALADNNAQVREEALRRGIGIARLAGKIGVPMTIGKFRGLIGPAYSENDWNSLKRGIIELCKAAEPGGSIVVEIQQSGPVNTFTNTGETLEKYTEIISETGLDNLGILLDTFHQERLDPSVSESFLSFGKKTGFIHIADTDRLVPGAGSIDFRSVLAAVAAAGYEGYLSMEVKQKPDGRTAARLCADYLRYLQEVVFGG